MRFGNLTVDTLTREVTLDGKSLILTPSEQGILEVLSSRLGHPVAREAVFGSVFKFDSEARLESIEIYVHRLRKKLVGSGVTITTMRGLGYALSVDS